MSHIENIGHHSRNFITHLVEKFFNMYWLKYLVTACIPVLLSLFPSHHNKQRDDRVCLVSVFLTVILVSIFFPTNSFSWHEDLGISDQKATEMYNSPILTPQTIIIKNDTLNWKEGLKDRYTFITVFCLPGSDGKNPDGERCKSEVKMVYDNCSHHPAIEELCTDPNIETYMIRHNLSGTYDMSYRRIEPIQPGEKGPMEQRAASMEDTNKKISDLCNLISPGKC